MDDLIFDPQAWAGAAQAADAAGDGAGTAAGAAGQALSGNAFGLMCSPLFLPAYQVVASLETTVLSAAADAVHATASNLRQAGAGLVDADGQAATRARRLVVP